MSLKRFAPRLHKSSLVPFCILLGVTLLCLLADLEPVRVADIDSQSNLSPYHSSKSDDLAKLLAEDAQSKIDEEIPADKVVTHRVRKGDTIARIWARFGLTSEVARFAEEALTRIGAGSSTLRSGEDIELRLTDSGQILEFNRKLLKGESVTLTSSDDGSYNAELTKPDIITKERKVSGTIHTCLASAALDADIPYSVIDELVDVLDDRIEFNRDLQPGDTFTVIYDEQTTPEGLVLGRGPIKAAAIHNNGKMLAAIRHTSRDGKATYFNETGKLQGEYFLRYPMAFTRVSSVFSDNRLHPILKIRRPHNGVDFSAPVGTPVRTVASGTVVAAGYDSAQGNYLRIKHDSRFTTAYLHLSRIMPGIRRGARVERGETIAAVGMTGLTSGPHLHFALYDNNRYTDPMKAKLPQISPGGERIPAALLASMLKTLKTEHEKTVVAASSSPRRRS